MTKELRPMLSATLERTDQLQGNLPCLVSPKLDGIRCRILDGKPISRSGKVIRNRFIQDWVAYNAEQLEHLDGELIVGVPYGEGVYNRSVSGIMSEAGEPDFTYWVFDHTLFPDQPYIYRLGRAEVATHALQNKHATSLVHEWIHSVDDLISYEAHMLSRGYEGVILRHPQMPYKHGRSTINQFGMVKVKRFLDAEAVVVDFEELEHNLNPEELNELGYTSHSSHKAGMARGNTLGALICRTTTTLPTSLQPNSVKLDIGTEFKIGTGFDQQTRQEIWDNQKAYVGKLVKFKYMPIGSIDKPRHPVWLGWRDVEDM